MRIFCFGFLQLMIGVGVVYFAWLDDTGFLASSPDKHKRLQSAKPPRTIFVGGSSVAFGVDSAMVRHLLPYEPVNMGLHGSLGLEYMLSEIEPHILPGDVVVLMLENGLFVKNTFSSVIWLNTILHRPEGFRELRLSRRQIVPLIDTGLGALGGLARQCANQLRGKPTSQPPPYTRQSFNEYGDVVAHHSMPSVRNISPETSSIDMTYLAVAIRRLNRFNEFCKSRNAKVVLYYSPMHVDRYRDAQKDILAVHHELLERLTIPILANPDETLHPAEEFFDTAAHLTYKGKQKRTRAFVQKFLQWAEKNCPPPKRVQQTEGMAGPKPGSRATNPSRREQKNVEPSP